MTTKAVTGFLEGLFEIHGKPREILTDNGPDYRDLFDKWCNKQGIKHIRSAIHKPTTVGKVERFHQTVDKELPYCHYQSNNESNHLSLEVSNLYSHLQKHPAAIGY